MAKSPDAFRTISEVAEWLDTPAHVLRFWESRFTQVKPVKRAGGRRYYRPNDMLLLGGIKKLLHDDGMTIKGVQKMLRTDGIKKVAALSQPIDAGEVGKDTGDVIDIQATEVEDAEVVQVSKVSPPIDAHPQTFAPPPDQQAKDVAKPTEPDLFATSKPSVPVDTPALEESGTASRTPDTVAADDSDTAAKPETTTPVSIPSSADSDKKAAITQIYSRLCALHDRMKDAIDPAQQG